MGSSSSKAAQGAARKFPTRSPGAAASAASRSGAGAAAAAASQGRAPAAPSQASRPPPPPPQGEPSTTKTQDISSDSTDAEVTEEFSARLRQMGIAQPNPTYSPTSRAGDLGLGPDPSVAKPGDAPLQTPGGAPVYPSASRNPTLRALEARRELQQRADEEFDLMGRSGSRGRQLIDLHTIVQMHLMRDKGARDADIESRFDLRPGLVARLGRKGLTVPAAAAVADADAGAGTGEGIRA